MSGISGARRRQLRELRSVSGLRRPGTRIGIRLNRVTEPADQQRVTFDLVINVGKGRRRAEMIRARLEPIIREMLAEDES